MWLMKQFESLSLLGKNLLKERLDIRTKAFAKGMGSFFQSHMVLHLMMVRK